MTHTVPWTQGVGKDDRDEDDELMRMRSIQVLPTPTQKVTIGQWLDGYRFVYNQCVVLSHECKRLRIKMPGLTEFIPIKASYVCFGIV